jgi:hypothetical protein
MKIPWTRKDEVFLSIVDPELFIVYSLIVGPQEQYFRRESEKAVVPNYKNVGFLFRKK